MTDKLHKASEIAASGLKDDSELYLSVRQEIEVHLQESAERLENAGQTHDKAIETALEKFGSPAEAADAILNVNKRRLKYRTRLRILLVVLIPILAIFACLFSIIPSLEYFYLLKQSDILRANPEKTYIKRIAARAGVDIQKLSLEDKLLLERDWKKLHEMFPKDKAYFAYYFMSSINRVTSIMQSGDPNTKYSQHVLGWLKEAQKIDPGNALYYYFAAGELLYFGAEYKRTGHHYYMEINNNARLMDALPYFITGLNQPFYNDYYPVIKSRRKKLAVNSNTPNGRFWSDYLNISYLYSHRTSDYIIQAMPLWIEQLIKTKQIRKAERIMNCWQPYLCQITRLDSGSHTYSARQILGVVEKRYPKFYQSIGQTEKGLKIKQKVNKLLAASKKRWDKRSPENEINQDIFLKHAAWTYRYSGSSFLADEYKPEELTAGRMEEYAQADRLLLVIVEILLTALILGHTICWLMLRRRLKKALHPVLFIPNMRNILVLVICGIIMPFVMWLLIVFLQTGGRDFSLNYNSINYLLQGLFLIIGTTLWPMALTRYFVDIHAKKLGLIAKAHLNGIILILFIAAGIGIISFINWKFPFNLELSTCFRRFYFYEEYIKTYSIYQLRLWHLLWGIGFLAAVFIINIPIIALCHWCDKDYLFKQGANSAAALVILSIILCVSALLADGYFYLQQAYFMKKNGFGCALFNRRSNDSKKIVNALTWPEQKLNNSPIDYFFVDDKSFCSAVVSSPYSVLKESLKHGANPNAANGYSALMLACRWRDAKVVRLLLAHGANVNKYCPAMKYKPRLDEELSGVNPIMLAAYYNPNPEVVKVLLKYGADVNSKALNGYSRQQYNKRKYGATWLSYKMTPLMFACWNNNAQVINVLLDNGANVWDKNAWGKDIFYYLGKNPKIHGNKIRNRIKAMRKAEKTLGI